MRRRDFVGLMGSAAVAPLLVTSTAHAQQAKPVVGFLDRGTPAGMEANLTGFRVGLGESGYAEGKNVVVEFRWAENKIDRPAAFAAELVAMKVDVIAATRSSAPALAAQKATHDIPIVFQTGSDPVKDGLVVSLNRPGGNVTGATRLSTQLVSKRIDLVVDVVPTAKKIGLLVNPDGIQTAELIAEMRTATTARALSFVIGNARNEAELDAAFAAMIQGGAAAVIEGNDPVFVGARKHIVALTMTHRIPMIFFEREPVARGGLMSYAASFSDSFRQVGSYVGRILKGAQPADLPVLQPTKFELVINMKTAKEFGLAMPPMLLATADEVIE